KRAPSLGFGNATLAAAQELYDKANYSKNFVTADGSMGAHNPDYSKNLLLDAKTKAQQVIAMLTPGRVTGRVVNPDGVGVGGIDVRSGGVTWTTTDSQGRFSFQFAQGTHSFDLYRGDERVGTISGVNILPDEEADVGIVRIAVAGGGAFFWYLLVLLVAVAGVALSVLYFRRTGGKRGKKEPEKPKEPEAKAEEAKDVETKTEPK
ncbi:MAG: hypothetical protein AABY30_00660, partial [Candidatus Thermoplasmatota archaeon]